MKLTFLGAVALAILLWLTPGQAHADYRCIYFDYYDDYGWNTSDSTCFSTDRDYYMFTRVWEPHEGGAGVPGSNLGEGALASNIVATSAGPDGCGATDRPVVISNGRKFLGEEDISTGGEAPFGLGRVYLSSGSGAGAFGSKWSSSLDFGLIFERSTGQCAATLTAATTCNTSPTGLTKILIRRPGGTVVTLLPVGSAWVGADGKLELQQIGTDWVLWSHIGVVETYNAGGQLKSTLDEANVGVTFNYTTGGKLSSVTHTSGRTLGITWTGTKITAVTFGAKVYTYGYNASGYLGSVTLPDAVGQTTYHYEVGSKPWLLTGKSIDGVRKTRYAYYPDERVSQSGDEGGGHQSNFTYGTNQTVVTNASGLATTYNYDTSGRLTSVTRAATPSCAASATASYYNAAGQLDYEVDGRGNRTRFTYTPLGNVDTIKAGESASGDTSKQLVTDYVWNAGETRIDAIREYTGSISAANFIRETVFEFYPDSDTNGRARLLRYVTFHDRQTTAAPARTHTYNYTFHANGLVARRTIDGPLSGTTDRWIYDFNTQGDLTKVTTPLGHATTLSNYTPTGQPGRIVDPNGLITDYVHDAKGRIESATVHAPMGDRTTSYDWDANDNLLGVTDASGRSVTASYNAAGEITQMLAPAAFPLGQQSKEVRNFVYNGLGKLTYRETLQSYLKYQIVGYVGGEPVMDWVVNVKEYGGTEWTYDSTGFITSSQGNNGQNFSLTYDANGDQATSTTSLGHVTTTSYDSHGRVASVISPNLASTKFEYNALGWPTKITDRSGRVTTYAYNGHGDLISISSPDTGLTTFGRDAAGRVDVVTRADGTTTDYVVDAVGRVTQATASWAAYNGVATPLVQTFTYDTCAGGKGRLCGFTDDTGSTAYTYTADGAIATQNSVIGSTSYTMTFAQDAFGRLWTATYPNGVVLRYSYSPDHRVAKIEASIAGVWSNVISSAKYLPFGGPLAGLVHGNGWNRQIDHDLDGRVAKIYGTGATHPQSLTFGYNTDNGITSITNARNSAASQTFNYDEMGYLLGVTAVSAGAQSWDYNATGSRTLHTWGGATDTYTIESGSNRISSISGSRPRTFSYDPQGNIRTDTRAGVTVERRYNGLNRLVKLIRPSAQTFQQPNGTTLSLPAGIWDYGYNALGQRVQKTKAGASTTRYLYGAGSQLLGDTSPGSTSISTVYVWLQGALVGVIRNGQVFAVHADQLGRPEVVTNSSNAIVWRASNLAFDRSVSVDALGGLSIGLPGQQYDDEAATWYNVFRDYDAAVGRYTQSDPIGLYGGANTYAYVGNNPLNAFDSLGLDTCLLTTMDEDGFENHSALWIERGFDGSPMLYDPNGSYAISHGGGSGDVVTDDAANIEDFKSWHRDRDGDSTSVDCKETSLQEEQNLGARVLNAPSTGFLGCAVSVSNVLFLSPSFIWVDPTYWPSELRAAARK